jgi:hypothetical protein
MRSNREGTSDFLDKVVDDMVAAQEKKAGVAKVASTNHPAEKAAKETNVVVKTNHPSEKMSKSAETKKTADDAGKQFDDGDNDADDLPGSTGDTDNDAKLAAEKAATEKVAAEKAAAEKPAKTEMTLHEARVARRAGSLVKVAGKVDVYQEAKTNNFWKITGSKVVRAFDENKGVAVEKK